MLRDAGHKSWFANLVSLGFAFMNSSPRPGCIIEVTQGEVIHAMIPEKTFVPLNNYSRNGGLCVCMRLENITIFTSAAS
ncbi:hypothetical protein Y032_0191g1301 [Ancylostoma ceylanicum]|uniref:Uncharacterized protein n=1 Tax=Ancylostoma ceylanicum TaxID=53326 RepID=A0A016SPP9_9BILA|nr:hypothetical protein Y032_0191g1301 [Ancylostoma ceylanicum]